MNDNLGTALASIRSSRLRSILTAAIISIGIMSLVGIQTAIGILSGELSDSFGKMGAEMKTVESREGAPPISLRQAVEFREIIPQSSISTTVAAMAEATSGSIHTDPVATVLASDINYLQCNGLRLGSGRWFSRREMDNRSHVCVIGNGVAEKLFGADDAEGCGLSFGAGAFTVTGTLEKRGAMFGGGTDYSIIVPLGSSGSCNADHTITFHTGNGTTESEKIVMRRIRKLRQGEDDDFSIRGGDSAAETFASLSSKLSAAALAIGLITMLGAAVGLMNTMLVSVRERRMETGLRKALGARNADIAKQFLTEAAMLGLAGGLTGTALGLAAGGCVAAVLDASFSVPWKWILISFLLCIVVSILSGLLPAGRAAGMPPVEALREQ